MNRLKKILNTKLPDSFSWPFKALCIIGLLILLCDILGVLPATLQEHRNRLQIVAKVDHVDVRKSAIGIELRNLLWRRGESWKTLNQEGRRKHLDEALQKIIDDRLIAQFAAERQSVSPTLQRASEDEFQQFLKQFPPPDEWKQRMELQVLDEQALRNRISDEVQQLKAIERWLADQPARVTEADAQAWFETHGTELAIPERVRASHIFLTRLADKDETQDRQAEIRELHRRLTAGEASFEDLAAKNSDDESAKRNDGDLGWFTRGRVPPEFAEKVFALPVGEVSAPFESHLGWHILLVKEKRPARAATFEEMKGEITAMLDAKWRGAAVKRLVEELRAKAKIEVFREKLDSVEP